MTLLTWPSCHEIRTRCIMTTAGVLNHRMINVRKVSVSDAKIQIDRRLIFCAGFSATCFCSNKWQKKQQHQCIIVIIVIKWRWCTGKEHFSEVTKILLNPISGHPGRRKSSSRNILREFTLFFLGALLWTKERTCFSHAEKRLWRDSATEKPLVRLARGWLCLCAMIGNCCGDSFPLKQKKTLKFGTSDLDHKHPPSSGIDTHSS